MAPAYIRFPGRSTLIRVHFLAFFQPAGCVLCLFRQCVIEQGPMVKLESISAVIFDMDGTLTVPVLDFAAMRDEMGITGRTPILEAMAAMTAERRAACECILARHEIDAAERNQLSPGAAELLGHLARRGIPMALLTRNCRRSVEAFCHKFGFGFAAIHTREDGTTKPSPEPVFHLCRAMNVQPDRTLVVGDYLFDIQSGQRAGARTCLIHQGDRPDYADQADVVVKRLDELISLLPLRQT
jgi:HAD superfamily hydrolase (TIGR01549 family)